MCLCIAKIYIQTIVPIGTKYSIHFKRQQYQEAFGKSILVDICYIKILVNEN